MARCFSGQGCGGRAAETESCGESGSEVGGGACVSRRCVPATRASGEFESGTRRGCPAEESAARVGSLHERSALDPRHNPAVIQTVQFVMSNGAVPSYCEASSMRQKLAWRTGYRTPRVVRSGCIFPDPRSQAVTHHFVVLIPARRVSIPSTRLTQEVRAQWRL